MCHIYIHTSEKKRENIGVWEQSVGSQEHQKITINQRNQICQVRKFSIFLCMGRCKSLCVCARTLSCVQLFVTPWTVALQASLSMGVSMQEYWNGLPFPIPGDLPNPGIELASLESPALADRFLPLVPPGVGPSESGLIEIICLICTSPIWGQYSEFPQGSPAHTDNCGILVYCYGRKYFISQSHLKPFGMDPMCSWMFR